MCIREVLPVKRLKPRANPVLATLSVLCLSPFAGNCLLAQQHALGLTLGRIAGPSRTLAGSLGGELEQSSGTALQANYAYRLTGGSKASFYLQTHFLANGQRVIRSGIPAASTDVATLYVTPGLRVQFLPGAVFSPWIEGGGGYALYEQSRLRVDGEPNDAGRFLHRGALEFGVGVDTKLWRFIGLRFEVRDFYTGNPGFNVPVQGSGQHNVVAGGGFVLRWGE
jgi:opacity protein-like surface antigen